MADGQGIRWNIFNLRSGLCKDGKRSEKAGGESSGAGWEATRTSPSHSANPCRCQDPWDPSKKVCPWVGKNHSVGHVREQGCRVAG